MGFRLIISGKVQVDIRLFIPFESKERLERNIKSGSTSGSPQTGHFLSGISNGRSPHTL